jgi:superfamily II DNA or RNA helicase
MKLFYNGQFVYSIAETLPLTFVDARIYNCQHDKELLDEYALSYLDGMLSKFKDPFPKSRNRLDIVAKIIYDCIRSGRKVLALSKHIRSADEIARRLKKVYNIDVLNFAGVDKAITKKEAANYDVIISTAQKFKRGIDVPWLDTLVEITPIGFHEQYLGRIRRTHKGKQKPLYVAFRDCGTIPFEELQDSKERKIRTVRSLKGRHHVAVRHLGN